MASPYGNGTPSGLIRVAWPSALSRRSVACSTEENHIMDITTLAAWGEFIGGIEVVVSSTRPAHGSFERDFSNLFDRLLW